MSMAITLENRVPPPIVTVAIGAGMWAASLMIPAYQLPSAVRYGAVIVLLIFGGFVGSQAFAAFRKAGTTINPVEIDKASSLVTSGVYSLTRNPMYVGLATLLVTLAVLLSNFWLLAGPLLFIAFTTRFQIIPEERAMLARFGGEYLAYKARVRRWV
jgi:protein-S-isoprenylcysteine O-methyltransferase Ste14